MAHIWVPIPDNNFIVRAFVDGTVAVRWLLLLAMPQGTGVNMKAKRSSGVGGSPMGGPLEHAAPVDGIEQIVLAVAATHAAAITLYESPGFRYFGYERGALKIGDQYV